MRPWSAEEGPGRGPTGRAPLRRLRGASDRIQKNRRVGRPFLHDSHTLVVQVLRIRLQDTFVPALTSRTGRKGANRELLPRHHVRRSPRSPALLGASAVSKVIVLFCFGSSSRFICSSSPNYTRRDPSTSTGLLSPIATQNVESQRVPLPPNGVVGQSDRPKAGQSAFAEEGAEQYDGRGCHVWWGVDLAIVGGDDVRWRSGSRKWKWEWSGPRGTRA